MSRLTFAIVSPSGDTIPLDTSDSPTSCFGLLDDTAGLGLVPRNVNVITGSGEGGRLGSVRVAPRSGTLSILVYGKDGPTLSNNIRRLAAAVRSVDSQSTPVLVATIDTGDQYSIPFTYESGAETIPTYVSGGAVQMPLAVIFPDPYWTALNAVQATVTGSLNPVGLLPDLAKLQLTPSNASGLLGIDNPGEVKAFPVWRVVGPETLVTATLGPKSWTLGPVAPGEVVTIDSKTNFCTLADGTNVYNRLGTSPKFFTLPAGHSNVTVTMTGAASGTWQATGPVLRTNQCVNPIPATITGWQGVGPGAVSTMTDGSPCFESTSNGALLPYIFSSAAASAVNSGEVWVLSALIDVVGDTAGSVYTVRAHGTTGNVYFTSGSTSYLAGSGLQRVTIVTTPTANVLAGEFNFTLVRTGGIPPAGVKLRMGKVQIEKASTPSSPVQFDGSTAASAAGFAIWSGPANAAPSTLSAATLVGQSSVTCFYRPRMEVVI